MVKNKSKRRIRYAVAGQGYIAQAAVLPAFDNAAKNSELVALISDDPAKLAKLAKKYDVKHTYDYSEYDRCLAGGEVDAVYIALPNHMHHEYTIRAAQAGIHVLCEKPMALTVGECQAMIWACQENRTKLMIAYRLHFEKANLKAIQIAGSGKLGNLRLFNSLFTMQVKEGNSRLQRALGGGTLYDIGIYCINAARYLFQDEPVKVFANRIHSDDTRFSEVEEMVSASLVFPQDRLATFICSFGAADVSTYQIVGTKGDLVVNNAYEFASSITHTLTIKGKKKQRTFAKRDQFAPELVYFSDCILKDKAPEPSGAESMADVRVINGLYRSAENQSPVTLNDFEHVSRPSPEQEIHRPSFEKPSLFHAEAPSRE
jgi:glucose-fructose oxidoreductase